MVQRKLPNKLGIQADNMKAEKRLGSLKPSSCQHLDGKNKATDLTKKMKKSRSIKLSDIEGLRSSPARKTIAQPGKPPPPLNVSAAASPQKKSVMKAMDGSSPNYMKSTSSSEAKKEISPVSSRNIQTGSDSKYLRRRSSTGSKISSGSCNKPARTLTKTSSLKFVRTLTKSPSFKPARASAKKCSRGVALCADMDAQRATCSSTLKDSKFPAYLMLNPGGTESEGTSVLKVCPYTYCSLNGHHHTPLPPLKCFLKARRRSLKTQRSMKMEALSPRRLKPSGDGTEELKAESVVFGSNGVDLDDVPMSPMMQERSMDFFIEIYAKGKGNDAEADRGSPEMKTEGTDGTEQEQEHDTEKPVSESLSEGSPRSEIDFEENLDHCSEIISKVESTETHHGDLKHNDADEDFGGIMVKEESTPWNFHDGDEQECPSSIVMNHAMFEVIDMEWEEWRFSASEPDNESHCSTETDDQSDLIIGDSSESDENSLHTGETEEILAAGAEQEVFGEDVACIDTDSQVSETISYDQVSLAEDMFQIFVAMEDEEDRNTDIDFTPSSTEELNEGQKILEDGISSTINEVSEVDPPQEVPEISCIIDVNDESLETTEQFQLQSSDVLEQDKTNEEQTDSIGDFCPEDLPDGEAGADEDNYAEDDNQKNQLTEVNNAVDESFSTQAIVDESLVSESQDLQSDSQHEDPNVVDNQSILEEDQGEAKSKVPTCLELEEQNCSMMLRTSSAEGSEKIGEMDLEDSTSVGLDLAEMLPEEGDSTRHEGRSRYTRSHAKEELPGDENNRKWTICRKKHEENYEEERQFNPREPNFLPVVPEPDAEKVDLRHQMMDDRKNAEDWMLDHALQQAVSKLAPARKRKVALLVEAFETVLPVPINKYETRLRHTSTGFVHGRPVQACN
ncbi:hypothetical protein CCACVL1_30718 [Corchorus capsularis]|uniref:Calmodulin-binding domain-containing protein n=1 Tax=Corchorus capsularis TaxID=210143 RepID=A0A1R3FVY7_COCAP|nr:hypothetical protein CCACVL1_30718 [Corchorus capsularis]